MESTHTQARVEIPTAGTPDELCRGGAENTLRFSGRPGLDLASLEYPQVRAGLILMMDRTFTADQNMVIVEKAIRYAPRGIVGVDIAGRVPALPLPLVDSMVAPVELRIGTSTLPTVAQWDLDVALPALT